jgi:hypothetical protein
MSGARTGQLARRKVFGPLNPLSNNAYQLRPLALSDVFLDEAGTLGAWQRLNIQLVPFPAPSVERSHTLIPRTPLLAQRK